MTVLCTASHFPLAYPIKRHNAAEDLKFLIDVFTKFGFPDEILSDCGTKFMSDVIQAFLYHCKVWHVRCRLYHPQSNGSLERLHRTLKNMFKSVMETYAGDWDEAISWTFC